MHSSFQAPHRIASTKLAVACVEWARTLYRFLPILVDFYPALGEWLNKKGSSPLLPRFGVLARQLAASLMATNPQRPPQSRESDATRQARLDFSSKAIAAKWIGVDFDFITACSHGKRIDIDEVIRLVQKAGGSIVPPLAEPCEPEFRTNTSVGDASLLPVDTR